MTAGIGRGTRSGPARPCLLSPGQAGQRRSRPNRRLSHGPGGLFSRITNFFTEEVQAEAAPAATAEEEQSADESTSFRYLIQQHAGAHGYRPPEDEDLLPLRELIRVDPAELERAWSEIKDLHTREFRPIGVERAKAGSVQDLLLSWVNDLPLSIGELLAVRAAVDLEYCDAAFMRQFIRFGLRLVGGWGTRVAQSGRLPPHYGEGHPLAGCQGQWGLPVRPPISSAGVQA